MVFGSIPVETRDFFYGARRDRSARCIVKYGLPSELLAVKIEPNPYAFIGHKIGNWVTEAGQIVK